MRKNMILSAVILSLFAFSAQAVEVKVREKVPQADAEFVQAFKDYLEGKTGFTPNSDKDIKRVEYENELLANAYFQKHHDQYFDSWVNVLVNDEMAKRMVREVQRSVKIDDAVARSYYLSNLKKYRAAKQAKVEVFLFETIEDAFDAYAYSRQHDANASMAYANAHAFKKMNYNTSINSLYPTVRASITDQDKQNYFTPPYLSSKKFALTYVYRVWDPDAIVPYEKVKAGIVRMLHKQTYLRTRRELIKKMMSRSDEKQK